MAPTKSKESPRKQVQNGWHRVKDETFVFVSRNTIRTVAVSVDGELIPAHLFMSDGGRWVPAIPPADLPELRRGVERGAYRIVR